MIMLAIILRVTLIAMIMFAILLALMALVTWYYLTSLYYQEESLQLSNDYKPTIACYLVISVIALARLFKPTLRIQVLVDPLDSPIMTLL